MIMLSVNKTKMFTTQLTSVADMTNNNRDHAITALIQNNKVRIIKTFSLLWLRPSAMANPSDTTPTPNYNEQKLSANSNNDLTHIF